MPPKPSSIIAQVPGSGTALAKAPMVSNSKEFSTRGEDDLVDLVGGSNVKIEAAIILVVRLVAGGGREEIGAHEGLGE